MEIICFLLGIWVGLEIEMRVDRWLRKYNDDNKNDKFYE